LTSNFQDPGLLESENLPRIVSSDAIAQGIMRISPPIAVDARQACGLAGGW
jgi:hypothetical protein